MTDSVRKFAEWLYERDILDKFIYSLEHYLDKTEPRILNIERVIWFIRWGVTSPKGTNWSDIDMEWQEYCKENAL